MSRKITEAIFALMFFFLVPSVSSQQWLSKLPKAGETLAGPEGGSPQQPLTLQDVQRAFNEYYKDHPVNLAGDKVAPTFRFEGAEEVQDRIDVEEYKLFKRWEWLMLPRTYPTGSLDFEQADKILELIPAVDNELLLKTAPQNPLNLKIVGGRVLEPPAQVWKPLGPDDAIGGTNLGRVNSVQFDPKNSKIIYVATPDGGVRKTNNAGSTSTPLFDHQPTLSVGEVAIDPTNSKVLYVATSDPFGYGTPFWGGTYSFGIQKSTDGGSTWMNTGLTFTAAQNRTIRRLAIHPTNGNILLAATDDGVHRTGNGGTTWVKVLPASAFDVEFQPNNGDIVYVTTTQALKSTNAGATFSPLAAGCPGQRYNIEVARSHPAILYTLCTDGTVQKSTDAGATWKTTSAPGVTLYGYYDNVLTVSPVNDKIVYVAGFNMKRTVDGGITWTGRSRRRTR